MVKGDFEIAPGRKASEWLTLELDPGNPNTSDWATARAIVSERIGRRFLEPVDFLIANEPSDAAFSFAIFAIDCLVIETIQGFREGVANHKGKSERLFTDFLKKWRPFVECMGDQNKSKEIAHRVFIGYRCALHHSGSTDGALRIRKTGPLAEVVSDQEININRTELHRALKIEFER